MAAVRVKLDKLATIEEVSEAFASFTSLPQELKLHSAPEQPIIVRDEPDRPQPRLDRDAGKRDERYHWPMCARIMCSTIASLR